MKRRQCQASDQWRGFSLVEMGVALLIASLVGVFAWRWIDGVRQPENLQQIAQQLAQARQAVEGFVLSHHRLPCPATSADSGTESCTGMAGFLPWRTLGLDARLGGLHYGVTSALATNPTASVHPDQGRDYSPLGDEATLPQAVKTARTSAQSQRNSVNGLDWCAVLRQFAVNPANMLQVSDGTQSMGVAYVLAHPGLNRQFEGNNVVGAAGMSFDFPGRPQTADYDDQLVAAGASDLSARIGCVSRLGAAQAAAQAAFTAYDSARLAYRFDLLRQFGVKTAQSVYDLAKAGRTLAAIDTALAAASFAQSAASTMITGGATAWATVSSGAAVAAASVSLDFAVSDLKSAKDGLEEAKAKNTASRAYLAAIYQEFAARLDEATAQDVKGLTP